MAKGINKVILIGNLGTEPKTNATDKGTKITSFSLATSDKWTDKNTGEVKEHTEWHNITCFNRLAEIAAQYLTKGSKVYIEGKLKTEKYLKDEIEFYSTKIIANELQMLDGKKENSVSNTSRADVSVNDFPDDDIPF